MFLGSAPFFVYSFGVFVRPIAEQTGWNRTHIAAAIGPAVLVIGPLCPFIGQLVDRYGPHRFAMFSVPALALGLILLGVLPNSATTFAAVLVLTAILGSGQTPVPYSYLISGWFDARRGLALGITLTVTGLGIAIIPPIAAALIATFGWRTAYVFLGGVVLVAGLPIAHWLIEDPPARQRSSSGTLPGSTLRQALSTRAFWTFVGSFFFIAMSLGAGIVPFPALLADRGVDPQRAAFIMSVIGLAMMVARVVSGALLDRFFAPRLAAALVVAPVLAHSLLATTISQPLAVVAALLFGLALGGEADLLAYMTSRAFGMRNFGKLFGITFCAFTAGMASGPPTVAFLFSHFGRYAPANWLAATAGSFAAILIVSLRRQDLPFVPVSASSSP